MEIRQDAQNCVLSNMEKISANIYSSKTDWMKLNMTHSKCKVMDDQ